MGYYNEIPPKHQGGKNKLKWYIISTCIGILIGASTILAFTLYVGNPIPINRNVMTTKTKVVSTKPENSSNSLATMIETAKQSVVSVINYQRTDPFQMENQKAGTGSGIIYKKNANKAYIITNNHVIQDAKKLTVRLSNGKELDAQILGSDMWTDLAVLQIEGKDVQTVASLGKSANVHVGDSVFAIGNPLGFEGTVTSGIISSVNRVIPLDVNGDKIIDWQQEVLQTDAAINPGNSGGALFNINGEVVGINSSKIAEQSVEGIGFSIPIDQAKIIIGNLETKGKVVRPALGIKPQSLEEIPMYYRTGRLYIPKELKEGVVVVGVEPNSPAQMAGIQELDVITALDDKPIQNTIAFRNYLYTKKNVKDSIKITFYRNGEKHEKTLILEELKS